MNIDKQAMISRHDILASKYGEIYMAIFLYNGTRLAAPYLCLDKDDAIDCAIKTIQKLIKDDYPYPCPKCGGPSSRNGVKTEKQGDYTCFDKECGHTFDGSNLKTFKKR